MYATNFCVELSGLKTQMLQVLCLRSYDSTPSISVLNSAAMVTKGAASRKGKPMPQIE
jgi:hypothetical protein